MSSSGPYQSRLLNLIVQQGRRLRDRSLETLRYVRMGAIWGTQILLYPIYAAVQASRLVGRQLNQAVRRVIPQLRTASQTIQTVTNPNATEPIPTADTPIQKVLQAIQTFALPGMDGLLVLASGAETPLLSSSPGDGYGMLIVAGSTAVTPSQNSTVDPSAPLVQSPNGRTLVPASVGQVIGIATLLDNRHLVLVTTENQLLDILTPEQQDRLNRQIIWGLANYWYSRRQVQLPPPTPGRVLPPITDREYLLPPVRAFWQVMAWMQRSPVAIATNLFQEAALLPAAPPSSTPDRPFEERLWDWMVGQGRSRLTPPLLDAEWHVDQWQVDQRQIDQSSAIPPLSSPNRPILQPNPHRFSGLRLRSPQPEVAPPPALPPSPLLMATQHVLKVRDGVARILQGLAPARPLSSSLPSTPQEEEEPSQPTASDRPGILSRLRSPLALLFQKKAATSPLPDAVFAQQVAPAPAPSRADTVSAPVGLGRSPQTQSNLELNRKPDLQQQSGDRPLSTPPVTVAHQPVAPSPSYPAAVATPTSMVKDESRTIDIQATLVGYVKHPLEQLLEWVDGVMVWLEEHTIRLWNWVQGRR